MTYKGPKATEPCWDCGRDRREPGVRVNNYRIRVRGKERGLCRNCYHKHHTPNRETGRQPELVVRPTSPLYEGGASQ